MTKPLNASPNALGFTNYRKFLSTYMEAHDLSYRRFARSFNQYVSFPFLSKLLRRNSNGEFTCEVNLRPEKLAALLKAMGLSAGEISHLVVCRLKNDQSQGQYKHSATFSSVLQGLKPAESSDSAPSVTKTDQNFIAGLRSLQPARRGKVQQELRHQLEIEIARTTSPLRIQTLTQLLGALE